MKFHEKLYKERKKKGLSQEELAEKLDVSRQAVSKWETGESVPETTKLIMIAKFFEVTTDYLLDDSVSEYIPPELTKNIDTADKIFGKTEKIFKKYSWLIGILVIFYGAFRLINGIIVVITAWQGFAVSGNIAFILSPLFNVLVGILLIAAGIVIVKKLKK